MVICRTKRGKYVPASMLMFLLYVTALFTQILWIATNELTGQNYTGTYNTWITFTLTEVTVNNVVEVQIVVSGADNLIPNTIDVW